MSSPKGFACDGCGHASPSIKYRCKVCKFTLDFSCITNHDQGQALKERVEKFTIYHRHKLQLLNFSLFQFTYWEDYVNQFSCCCCLKIIQDSAYTCKLCEIYIHESCLDTIPKQFKSSFDLKHPLRFRKIPESTDCDACGERVREIGLSCEICDYSFHISCGKYTAPSLKVKDHEHGLFYIDRLDWENFCAICRDSCEGAIYRCIQCHKNFHVKCILPPVVNHECHDHSLTLTNSVVPRSNPYKYSCDVCEKDGDIKHHVYHCEECWYISHIECLLSEEDPSLEIVLSNDESELPIADVQEIEEKDDPEVNGLENEDDGSEESDESEEYSRGIGSPVSETDSDFVKDFEHCSIKQLDQKINYYRDKMEKIAFLLQVLEVERDKKLGSQA